MYIYLSLNDSLEPDRVLNKEVHYINSRVYHTESSKLGTMIQLPSSFLNQTDVQQFTITYHALRDIFEHL